MLTSAGDILCCACFQKRGDKIRASLLIKSQRMPEASNLQILSLYIQQNLHNNSRSLHCEKDASQNKHYMLPLFINCKSFIEPPLLFALTKRSDAARYFSQKALAFYRRLFALLPSYCIAIKLSKKTALFCFFK